MRKLSLILAIISIVTVLGCSQTGMAFAAENVYSFVMDDLQKDPSFIDLEYPVVEGDCTLQVIQLAESSDGELFVYTYQPGAETYPFNATSIVLARSNAGNLNFTSYNLTFLNSSGVFYKYKLTNFQSTKGNIRYYNVASISRPWDKDKDPATDGNKISEVAYEVARLWTVTGNGDNITYVMEETEVIEITGKYVGYVNYSDGYKMSFGDTTLGATSAHFVAFSTNRDMDKLLQAKLEYKTQEVKYKTCYNPLHSHFMKPYDITRGGVSEPQEVVLHDNDYAKTNVGVSFASKHEWKRIMTPTEFLEYHNNDEYQIVTKDSENISDKQWVLSFYETSILAQTDVGWAKVLSPLSVFWLGEGELQYTEVSDVMLLELTFQKNGKVYSMGVVDNKQTGSGKPSNAANPIENLQDILDRIESFFTSMKNFGQWLKQYWWTLLVLALIVFFIISLCFRGGRKLLGLLFKGLGILIWIILKWTIFLPVTLAVRKVKS